MAIVDGEQVNDSSAIITHIAQATGVEHDTPEDQREEEAQWREWVDAHLVHLLAPNIYRTVSESLQSFDYITSNSNFSKAEKTFIRCVAAAAVRGPARPRAHLPAQLRRGGHHVCGCQPRDQAQVQDWGPAGGPLRGRRPVGAHRATPLPPAPRSRPTDALPPPAPGTGGRPRRAELPGRGQAQHGRPLGLRRHQVPHGHGVRAAAAPAQTHARAATLTASPPARSTGADVLRNTQLEPWYRRMESQVGDTLASPVPPDAVEHP